MPMVSDTNNMGSGAMAQPKTNEELQTSRETGIVFQVIARQRIKVLDRILSKHSLTTAQVYLLNCLLREDGQTQISLSRELGIGTVAVSGMIDRLEASDWVERRADPNDRRSKRVWLRESAKSRKKVLAEAHNELDKISYAGLTNAEIAQLLDLMRRVRKNLNDSLQGEPIAVGSRDD